MFCAAQYVYQTLIYVYIKWPFYPIYMDILFYSVQ